MPWSNVKQLWNGVQDLVNLKHIDLRCSKYLKEVPNLSKALNLQQLNLCDCKRLRKLSDNIPSKFITLHGCLNLKVAPRISRKVEVLDLSKTAIKKSPFIEDQSRLVRLDLSNCSRLECLSSSICKCKFIEYLYVDGCLKLERLPEDIGNLEALKTLFAEGSGLREVPSSILNLNKLSSFSLSRCRDQCPLNCLPNPLSYHLRSLQYLELANCQLAKLPEDIGQLSSLQQLDLSGNNFESIPTSIKDLSKLCHLDISYSEMLISLPELPRGINVDASYCSSLESISKLPLQVWPMLRPQSLDLTACFKLNLSEILHKESYQKNFQNVCCPGNQIPDWFDFKVEGSKIYGNRGQCWTHEEVLGFNMCVVVEVVDHYECIRPVIFCSFNITGRVIYRTEVYEFIGDACSHRCWSVMAYYGGSDHVIIDFVPISNINTHSTKYNENHADYDTCLNIGLKALNKGIDLKIKKCGIHFVYGSNCGNPYYGCDLIMSEILSILPEGLFEEYNRYEMDEESSDEEESEEEEESYDEEESEEEEESYDEESYEEEDSEEEEESYDEEESEEEEESYDERSCKRKRNLMRRSCRGKMGNLIIGMRLTHKVLSLSRKKGKKNM